MRVCRVRVSFSIWLENDFIFEFFFRFPKGSLFRLAKCLFPSVRAKES